MLAGWKKNSLMIEVWEEKEDLGDQERDY